MKTMRFRSAFAVAALAMAFCVSGWSAETNPFGVTNPFEIGGTGGGGGGVAKFFGSTAERDAYFQTNDKELRNGVTAAIGDPAVIYMWNGTAWVEAANTFIGAKGDTGAQGIQGIPGNDGAAATVSVGTVTTLSPGSSATVENVGTSSDAVFDFGIPRGADGNGGGGTAGVSSWNGQTGDVTFTESDPTYAADKSGTMQLGDVDISGSLTLSGPPLSPAEATNKAYVDSAIGAATQDVADNYAVKPDSRSGYVMPPQVFDYADSNTFTVDAAPKFVLEAMILRPDSFTYMQQSDISFSGTSVTLNNVTINSGDKVKITYAIQ